MIWNLKPVPLWFMQCVCVCLTEQRPLVQHSGCGKRVSMFVAKTRHRNWRSQVRASQMQTPIDASETRNEGSFCIEALHLSPISAEAFFFAYKYIAVVILVLGCLGNAIPQQALVRVMLGSLYPRFPNERKWPRPLPTHSVEYAARKSETSASPHCLEWDLRKNHPRLSYSQGHPSQNRCCCASNHLASRTTGSCVCANRSLGPREGVRSRVVAFSVSDIVDARSLWRNKVLLPSISIRALDGDSGHVASHAIIRHHRAIVVCRNRTHSSTPSVALLTAEATTFCDVHMPPPCSTAGCKARENLDCHSAQSCCKCFWHHGGFQSKGSVVSESDITANKSWDHSGCCKHIATHGNGMQWVWQKNAWDTQYWSVGLSENKVFPVPWWGLNHAVETHQKSVKSSVKTIDGCLTRCPGFLQDLGNRMHGSPGFLQPCTRKVSVSTVFFCRGSEHSCFGHFQVQPWKKCVCGSQF